MEKRFTELIMKLDYIQEKDIKKLISIMGKTNLKINQIGVDEYSVIIEE